MAENDNDKEKDSQAVNPDLQELRALYDLMLQEGLDDLEVKDERSRIKLSRAPAPVREPVHRPAAHHSPSAPAVPSQRPNHLQPITTPLAGVFYRAASPNSAPFVQEGATVDAGQTLCIIEAMKLMNEIKAEKSGRIVKILVENSRPVAAGQELFLVEPVA